MKNILFLCFYFIALNSWSQNSDSDISLNKDSLSVQSQSINSVYDIRKNSVYYEVGGEGVLGSVNYNRIIPVGDKNGIVLVGAVGVLGDIACEINYLHGKSKNYIEIGIGYSFPEHLIFPQIGYRYQGSKGFLFRVGVIYLKSTQPDSFGDFPWFALSFGYSF